MSNNKCECGNDLEKYEVPEEDVLFTLFSYEFIIRYWDYRYTDFCIDCISDMDDEPYKQAYRAGQKDGFNEAMQEMRY